MPQVTSEAIVTAVTRLAVHYKGSFPTSNEVSITCMEYERCLGRMPWCDDDTFLAAVDEVIDQEQTRGFLPEWSLFRSHARAIVRKRAEHDQAGRAICDIRERSALSAGPEAEDAAFQTYFGASKSDGEQPTGQGRQDT